MNNLYYKTSQGNWISHIKLEALFHQENGCYSFEAPREFITWLGANLGNTILEIRRANDAYLIDEFIKAKQNILAIRALHLYYGFSLSKAKQIVDETCAKLHLVREI